MRKGLRIYYTIFHVVEYFPGARIIIFRNPKPYKIACLREDFWNLVVPRYRFP